MTASGSSLQKTSGCDGCPDATAVSQQQVTSAGGRLQFTATEAGTLRFIGLSVDGIGAQPSDLRFALRLQSGTVEVRESGAYKSETSFQSGDTLGIVIANGVVTYVKNGSVFYTSASQATDSQRVHAIFSGLNATVGDFRVGTASSAALSSTSNALASHGVQPQPPSSANSNAAPPNVVSSGPRR